MKSAFSLVELSIVLVILGLLTGGILTGQSLIRSAELRSITTQQSSYQTAAYSFRDKYMNLPGDLKNVSDFWSDATNGDADGEIEQASAGSAAGEMFGFWQQLALAGLVEGSFDGTAGSGGGNDVEVTNSPSSKLSNGAWTAYRSDFWGTSAANALIVGANTTSGYTSGAIISPEEAWNLDTKIDDGKPEQGKVLGLEDLSAADNTACSNTTTGTYSLDNSTQQCALVFKGL